MDHGGCSRGMRAQRLWGHARHQDRHCHDDNGARASRDDQRFAGTQDAGAAAQSARKLIDAIVRRQHHRQEGDDNLRLR